MGAGAGAIIFISGCGETDRSREILGACSNRSMDFCMSGGPPPPGVQPQLYKSVVEISHCHKLPLTFSHVKHEVLPVQTSAHLA